ncbi:sugar ABC transporter permease [Brenneria sp. 4F2]|nr:sugar ABC transporter permease [Brenneria bubanii]
MLDTALPDKTAAPRFCRLRALLEPWLYLSPTMVLIGLFIFVPMAIGISYAFQNIQLLNPFDSGWVGLDNFRTMFDDRRFYAALRHTVNWTLTSLILQFTLGLGLALLLNREFTGRRWVQALVFLPWAVPAFLSGLTWAWLLNPVIGVLPHWLAALHVISEPYNILSDPQLALFGPVLANVWFGIPFFAITLLAALQSIPKDLYEAAAMDGATGWQQFCKVTLPFLAPMIAITVMLRTIWIANFADLIVVMTDGGPANSTSILSSFIFTTAYRKLDFGYASAIAVFLLVLMTLYALVLLRIRHQLLK